MSGGGQNTIVLRTVFEFQSDASDRRARRHTLDRFHIYVDYLRWLGYE